MNRPVYAVAEEVMSCLGMGSGEHWEALRSGRTGLAPINGWSPQIDPVWAGRVDAGQVDDRFASIGNPSRYTRLEKMLLCCGNRVLELTGADPADKRTLVVLATTKGNIDLWDPGKKHAFGEDRVELAALMHALRSYWKLPELPILVSNACISGVVALILAKRYLSTGLYDRALVLGGDLVSYFVLSGFQSFLALSQGPCKPYDRDRSGLCIGDGAAAMLLTTSGDDLLASPRITLGGGGISNDANHISGPSRDGSGLRQSIAYALTGSGLQAGQIDFVSAHGTATPYNDEMESKAFHAAGLEKTPVFSLKGAFGHTLGAAGLLEGALAVQGLRMNVIPPSLGYENHGLSLPLEINKTFAEQTMTHALKTASGFGGGNAGLVFTKQSA